MSTLSLTHAQQQFTAYLPAIDNAARFAFRRRMRRQEYEEALAEARAAAWSAWHGLIRKGKDPLAVGVTGIANNAIRNVKSGRRVGNTSCGPGAMDVFRKAQKARDFKVVSLDSNDQIIRGWLVGTWKEWLARDHRVGPADTAAFRVDFAVWLTGLPVRKRQIAELLTEGHEPGLVARIVGVSPARVSQLRHELEAGWLEFQGGATVPV